MIDALSMAEGISFSTISHNAYIGEGIFWEIFNIHDIFTIKGVYVDKACLAGTIKGVPVVLAKPQTYANLIGESVSLSPTCLIF